MSTERYSDEMRGEAKHIWDRILEHPFLVEMSYGQLPLEKFRYYVKQDYAYLVDFVRCLAISLDRVEDIDTIRVFVAQLGANMEIELDALEDLGARIGLNIDDLRKREMSPTNLGYTRHLFHVSHTGTTSEIIAAMLPCIWTYEVIAEKIGFEEGLRGHPIYNEWCDTYRSPEYGALVEWYRSFVDIKAREAGPAIKKRMMEHFLTSSRYEYMFWDMAYNLEEWPV